MANSSDVYRLDALSGSCQSNLAAEDEAQRRVTVLAEAFAALRAPRPVCRSIQVFIL